MFRTARSPLGTLALLIVLAPSIAGCMSTQHIPFNNTAKLDRITGVTTRSGREIPFFEPGASVTNDTLYAVDRRGQLILPTDSIARVWNRKFSAVRTVGLVGGLALVGAAIAGFSALGNMKFFPSQ